MNEKVEYRTITLTSNDEKELKDAANISASSSRVASDKALQDNTVYTVKSSKVESFEDKDKKMRYFIDILFEDGSRCPSGCFNGTPLGEALTYQSEVCNSSDTIGQRIYKNTRALAGSTWKMLGHSTELVGKQNFKHTTWRNMFEGGIEDYVEVEEVSETQIAKRN